MQPGYPPPGQDPYGQPQYGDPYAQPGYPDPYARPQPTSGGEHPAGAYPAYPHAGYEVPGYGPAPSGQSNALGIVALVLGILSIPFGLCGIFGLLLPLPAIICGVIGMKKANLGLADNRGLALAGMICGLVGLLVGGLVAVFQLKDLANTSWYS